MDTCARCGASFGCGRTQGKPSCWCAELPAALPVPAEGEGACLCPACLGEDVARARLRLGQCLDCRHRKALRSKGGDDLVLCGLSGEDAQFAKYPRLPMTGCAGFAPARKPAQ